MQFLEQLAKQVEKNCEFNPKSYYSNDYKINCEQRVAVPQNDSSITFLLRGGSSKMITVLHLEGGVPPNDYSWLHRGGRVWKKPKIYYVILEQPRIVNDIYEIGNQP